MRKLLSWSGAALGGSLGWWLGARVGMGTALVVSGIGSAAGGYAVVRILRDYLG